MQSIVRLAGMFILFVAAVAIPPMARAAESFDACAGFIDSLPAIISSQGTWCLRKDLTTAMTDGNAISIEANNITIDCNGFKVGGLAAGEDSTTNGVYAYNKLNATVRHCNLRGFNHGIKLEGTSGGGHLVEDNRIDQSLVRGIYVDGEGNLVRGNRVFDTGGYASSTTSWGIGGHADFIGNTVSGVYVAGNGLQYVYGIALASPGIVASGNTVRGLAYSGSVGGVVGIYASALATGTIIRGNQVSALEPGINGYGILGAATDKSLCTDNMISFFTAAIGACGDAGGNGSN